VKVEPGSGLTDGGTQIEVSGLWFDFKPQYGMIPQCRIGDKIVRATFHSTVRIVCVSPPNTDIYKPLPVHVTLNGVDWVDTGFTFSYYIQAIIKDIQPKIGAINSGTQVDIIGENFSNITDPEQTKCRWTLIDNVNIENRPTIVQHTPAIYFNKTTMMCMTPSYFIGGDRAFVQLTFNNYDYSDFDDNLVFQFYQIGSMFPKSGPSNTQNEVITIKGSGFVPKSKVVCSLNRTE
jgi:hypothetical protein